MSKLCYGCFEEYNERLDLCPHCGYEDSEAPEEVTHLAPGQILKDTYVIGKVLGYGGFGVTYLGWNTVLQQKVAIKEYLPSEFSTRMPGHSQVTVFNGEKSEQFHDGVDKFVDEANKLAQFRNTDGIVLIYESFHENNTAYIIMEYLDGQTLTKRLEATGPLPADEAVRLMTPIVQSLQIVHAQGIIHRDIAPDNIIVTQEGQVKLIDFGAARFATTSHSRSLTVVIKPGYSPEEQYRSRGDQGPWTDVYAVGATLYRMITGTAPPDAMERRAFFEGKKKDILTPLAKISKSIAKNQETAILNAMNVRIEDRTPDMAAFEQELNSRDEVKRRYGKIKKIDMMNWPVWMKIAIPVAACLVVVLSSLFAVGLIGFSSSLIMDSIVPAGMAKVPSVINTDVSKAEQRLTDVVLLPTVVGKEFSGMIPANMVLKQDVVAGTVVMQNTLIPLTISGGAETRTVPDISGMDVDEAVAVLENLGFTIQIESEYSSTFAQNAVITQSSAGDEELELGAAITLVVSMGMDPNDQGERILTKVPDFVGLSYNDAQKSAQAAGFLLSIQGREYSAVVGKDKVISQSVSAGSELMSGDTVRLVVSLGVQVIKVADVQYKTESEARNILEGQGLAVNVAYAESETIAKNLVIAQNPVAQASVNPNGTVTITVSTGGKSFEMPNVIGLAEAKARSDLGAKGLVVNTEYALNQSVPVGNVISQSVAAKTMVNRGDSVAITVSKASQTVLTKIEVIPPNQTTYALGEGLNLGGMVVTATYSDNSTRNVTSFCSTSGFNSSSAGTKTVTVSYAEDGTTKTATFSVTVNAAAKALHHIEVIPPSKDAYNVGDSFNSGGMVVTAVYNDNTTKNVTSASKTSGFDSSSPGVKYITVSYTEDGATHTAQFSISVDAVTVATLVRIEVIPPDKTSYEIGDSFSSAGMTVYAYYSNNSNDIVTSSCATSGFNSSSAGTKTITVSYTDGGITKTAQFNVTVNAKAAPVVSDWTKVQSMPSGAKVTDRKWTYDLTETIETTDSSVSGAVKTGERWAQSGSGSVEYASFPSGFDQSHSLYSTYNKQPVSAFENATTRRTVTTNRTGFIYWHWTYEPGSSTGSVNNRLIQSYRGYDSVSGYNYIYFHAVVNNNDYPFYPSGNAYQWNGGGIYWTWWWYRIDINRCDYVDYTKYNTFTKTQAKESSAYPTESNATNIQEWVKYTM